MILQALYEYAQRKGDALPEDGFETKELKFLIKIKEDGTFVRLEDTRQEKDGRLVGRFYRVPQSLKRSGVKSYKTTFLLWDHYGYILNEPKKESDSSKKEKAISDAAKQNRTFIESLNSLPDYLKNDKGVAAIIAFYGKYQKDNYVIVKQSEVWSECVKIPGCNLSFIINGDDGPVFEREAVKDYQRSIISKQSSIQIDSDVTNDIVNGVCLITGEKSVIKRLHTQTYISGAKSTALLIGFQKNSGYDSYGKEQSYNAPVSVKAEAAYTKALNYLIKSRNNRFRLGEDTVVFWAEKKEAEQFESAFSVFFSKDFDSDDPDRRVHEVRNLFNAVNTGKFDSDFSSNFYVLCLSPNAARISVRFWETGRVETFAKRIKQHFEDFEIVRPKDSPEYLNLYQILSATALEHKLDSVAPNLIGNVVQSVLKGLPYPVPLQQQCIRRVRAEQKVTRERAAILKAYINRINRNKGIKEVSVALNRDEKNKGYLLGRLFAVFEKVQQDTHPGLNATIVDRFYGAASTNPRTVFAQLSRLNRHHLSSYDNPAFRVNREKEIGEIMNLIDSFPAHLDLNEQSYFAIGYYHEKQSFFEKTNKSEETEGDN